MNKLQVTLIMIVQLGIIFLIPFFVRGTAIYLFIMYICCDLLLDYHLGVLRHAKPKRKQQRHNSK